MVKKKYHVILFSILLLTLSCKTEHKKDNELNVVKSKSQEKTILMKKMQMKKY